MAAITEVTDSWSAGVALTEDEVWQVQAGNVLITTKDTPDPDDGTELSGSRYGLKDAVSISSGKTVRYKRAPGSKPPYKITRESF